MSICLESFLPGKATDSSSRFCAPMLKTVVSEV
jgi:hypothetical protein